MLPQFRKYQDNELDDVVRRLAVIFTNISKDNFTANEIAGVTSSTPDERLEIAHGFESLPAMALMLEGNAYVAINGLGAKTVDVRSSAASQPFKLLVIR